MAQRGTQIRDQVKDGSLSKSREYKERETAWINTQKKVRSLSKTPSPHLKQRTIPMAS
jgi:hypothetical protein